MKKNLLLGVFVLASFLMKAQAPQKISYQAVIRNASNVILASKTIGLKIAILRGGDEPVTVYSETQNPVTNSNGLMSLQIGSGRVLSGDITKITWATGAYYIKTDIDPDGGTNYSISGLTELTSVPFALFAATSGSLEIEPGNYTKGPKGDTGATGLTGDTGPKGDAGSIGPAGPQGISGNQGATGPTGSPGERGFTGDFGPMGLPGERGLPGPAGPQGLVGERGLAGPTGPQGIPGIDGVGPTGPKGDVGLTGDIGPMGLRGEMGFTGAAGPQGLRGETGVTGAVGAQGIPGIDGVGPTGPKGDIGLTGAVGPQGLRGEMGLTGAVGPQGIPGIDGVGPTGPKGDMGLTGAVGPQGLQGNPGPVGPAGGFSGTFSGDVTFSGNFSANGGFNSLGSPGTTSGQGVRIGNSRFTFNKPNNPVVFQNDYSATVSDIFDAGIVIGERRARLMMPSANDLVHHLPAGKAVGDILSLMVVCLDQPINIVPGTGGSLIGSDVVTASSQRIIYMRFTDINNPTYVIY